MPEKKNLEGLKNAIREYCEFLRDGDQTDEEKKRYEKFSDLCYMKIVKMVVKGININDEKERGSFYKKEEAKIKKWAIREINKIKKQDKNNTL